MAPDLPAGTTAPRGLPRPEKIHWPLIPARSLFGLKYGKALVEADRRPGTIPVYGTNGRCGSHDEALFKGPGVILGRKGQGPLGVEWSEGDYWVIDTAYSLALLRSDIDLRYSYFLIKHIGLNHLKDGTSNPTLSRDTFGAQALPVPPITDQRAIAYILGTVDDKIALNRRMNETLEGMARALFKSWFVNFDPIRAKVEGRDPGLPKHISGLFPDRFEESELGQIPKGWRVRKWRELIALDYGKALRGYEDVKGPYPVYGTNGLIGRHSEALCKHPGIIIGRKGAYRGVHYSPEPFFVIDTAFFASPKCELELRWAYYEMLRVDINEMDSGSAIPSTSRDSFYNLPVVFPLYEIQRQLVIILAPIWERQRNNEQETRTLAALRDALLPKLISGELRLKDAERLIERTT